MADSKISALPSSTTPLAGTETLPVVQSGTTKQVSVANLTAGRAVSAASLALTTTPLPASSGGTALTSFNSAGLLWANSTSTLASTTAITVVGGGLGIYFNAANLSGNFWQARYNSSNFPMSVATGNVNGFPFLGVNVNGVGGSDDGAFDINGWAGRIRLDNGNCRIQQSTASGTAGNAITWVTAVQTDTSLAFKPGADNTQTLGTAALRWSTVYAGTALINTSDARLKEQVENLDDIERKVAIKIKSLVKKFKFKDAVAKKGDDARIHVGVLAQEVQEAFESEGLDPNRYALFCYDEWQDEFEPIKTESRVIDDQGNEHVELVETGEMKQTQVAGNRFGIRYDQLLAFVIASL